MAQQPQPLVPVVVETVSLVALESFPARLVSQSFSLVVSLLWIGGNEVNILH